MPVVELAGLADALNQPAPIDSGWVTAQYVVSDAPAIRVDGANVTFPEELVVTFVNGQPVEPIAVVPTLGVSCVKWVFRFGSFRFERFTSIPDVAGPIAFGDLPVVDPDTYLPIQPGSTVAETIAAELAAWLAENPPTEGPPGPANVLSIGTVTTLAPGESATAQITGQSPDQVLNLGIPTGPQGVAGNPTAFELRGAGTPEGSVTAGVGTYYTDTAATNGAIRWVKASGVGNAGWRVVYGDTGWRNVSSLVTGLTGGRVLLRRVNHEVFVVADSFATVTVGQNFLFPVGFEYGSDAVNAIVAIPGSLNVRILGRFTVGGAPRTVLDVQGAQGAAKWQAVFIAQDAWPSTLPGTPA